MMRKVRQYILKDVHKHIYAHCILNMCSSDMNTEANFRMGRKQPNVEGIQTLVHPWVRTLNHSCVILPK